MLSLFDFARRAPGPDELLATPDGQGIPRDLAAPAPGLPQRGVGAGAAGRLRGRADLLPPGLPGQSVRRPHPAQHGDCLHQDRPAGRGDPALQARPGAGPRPGRRALRRRVPSAQAGRRAAGGGPPARLPGPAPQGPRRRSLDPPRRERAARHREQSRAGDDVSRWRRLLPVLAVLGCSGLDEGDSGVVALQVEVPVPPDVEVGDTLQLHATALDANGDPVDVAISWQAADPTVSVNATGLVTGVSAGTGRVQAREGSLGSNVVTLTVIARADTLLLLG